MDSNLGIDLQLETMFKYELDKSHVTLGCFDTDYSSLVFTAPNWLPVSCCEVESSLLF